MSDRDPNRPPQRRRWWKLALVALAFTTLLLVLGVALWRGKAHAEMVKRVEALRARGEPIAVADLTEPDVAESDNMVPLIRAAAAVYTEDADRTQRRNDISLNDRRSFTVPLTDEELALTRADVAANEKALALIAPVDTKGSVAWHDTLTSPLIAYVDPDLRGLRNVANLLRETARVAEHDGRSDVAVDALLDLEAITRAAYRKPLLIGYLVGSGIDNVTAQVATEIAPTLQVDRAMSDGKPAPRAAIDRVIAALNNDDAAARRFANGLRGERVATHEAMQSALALTPGGAKPKPLVAWAMSPILDANDTATLDYYEAAIQIADAPSLATFVSRSAALDRAKAAITGSNTLLLAKTWMPAIEFIYEARYRAQTDRHLAAAALAIRLYALDHDGQRPASLDALVPAYIARVPLDAIDGQPLRYDAKRAILWSVGDNGKDEGGNETPRKPQYAGDPWQCLDAVVHLDRQPRPTTQPATATTSPTSGGPG